MLSYSLSLAWRSLFQRKGLTVLMIFAVAIGLGILMTIRTMAHNSQQLPAGAKSAELRFVQMDAREVDADPLNEWYEGDGLTYIDAEAMLRAATPADQQTYLWKTEVIVSSEDESLLPRRGRTLAGLSNFFEMFDAPFLFGSTWSSSADVGAEPVVVISKRYNDYFFGGEDSVGRQLKLGTNTATIIGVLDDWRLSRSYYDMSFDAARRDDVFVPSRLAIEWNFPRTAGIGCRASDAEQSAEYRTADVAGLLSSECGWLMYWAQLSDGTAVEEYRELLRQHIQSQKSVGRFPRDEPTVFLSNVVEHMELVGPFGGREAFLQIMSNLFFAVCLINAIGILLAKFTSKSREVSLRRALGAKKKTIMQQHLLEVVIIGLLGGALGIFLSYFGLLGMRSIAVYAQDYSISAAEIAHAYQLDFKMILSAFGIAIGSTILVGLYPIWRICNGTPAQQLKA